MINKTLHLKVSAIIVIAVALAYGISPNRVLPLLVNITAYSTDMSNLLRAIMCLYLGFAAFWVWGTIKSNHTRNATITNVIFMGSLATGRLLSIVLDGLPSKVFIIGLLVEILLMTWGILNLKSK